MPSQLAANKSTTVRAPSPAPAPAAPAALRAGLAALWAVAPGLAARWAVRRFLTPPRHPAPRGERAALARAVPVSVPYAGGALRGWRFGWGPAVLLVHGWGGRGGQLTPLAEALAAAGMSAIAIDGPAHGASSGRTASVVRFADAISAAARATGARAAVGHSMGGAAVALAAARGLALDAAVLIASPRGPAGFLELHAAALGLHGARRDALRAALERRIAVPLAALDLPALAPDAPPPVLVMQDRADREVAFDDGAAIAAAWSGARLLATEGLGHRRILRDAAAVAAAVAFVEARLARCACGRLALAPGPAPRCAGCAVAEDLWARGRRRARIAGERVAAPLASGPSSTA